MNQQTNQAQKMISVFQGKITSRGLDGITATFDLGCSNCHNSCSLVQKQIQLPKKIVIARDQDAQSLNVSMSLPAQLYLQLNSLLLPIFGFIFAAILGEFFNLEEGPLVLITLFGLLISILLCRELPVTKLDIKEVY